MLGLLDSFTKITDRGQARQSLIAYPVNSSQHLQGGNCCSQQGYTTLHYTADTTLVTKSIYSIRLFLSGLGKGFVLVEGEVMVVPITSINYLLVTNQSDTARITRSNRMKYKTITIDCGL